jgi:hypothetical protein
MLLLAMKALPISGSLANHSSNLHAKLVRLVRTYAAETYLKLLMDKDRILPDVLLQVIAWVLGEYSHLAKSASREQICKMLAQAMERHHDDPSTR